MFTWTIFATGEQLISGNIEYKELLLTLVLSWLRTRRGRRRRAREQQATEVQNILYVVMGLQQQMLVCTSLASARHLLQGTRVDRSMWVKHRSTAFFQDMVPGWTDHDAISGLVMQHIAKRCLMCVNAINPRIHHIMQI